MNKLLKRYWLEIDGEEYLPYIGMTAFGEEDIENLLREKVGKTLKIISLKIIDSIGELDQNHVIPNMEEFVSRGIWYLKGYR